MPSSVSAFTIAHPNTTPMTRPRNVPSRAMITDSQRTLERSWRRVMPTARSSPSSWRRSMIDSPSVLAMPNRAMMIAKNSST